MKNFFCNLVMGVTALLIVSCSGNKEQQQESKTEADTTMRNTKELFGKMENGQDVYLYTLSNKNGVKLKVMNYGGIVVSLEAPDKNGKLADVVLGFDSLSSYMKQNPFFGALVGRYGNRIANGSFALDGVTYTLAKNNDKNHLHGGVKGFDKVWWNIEEISGMEGASLKLSYTSKDGEEGYPGNLSVEVIYTLTDDNEWKITYQATTDKKTIINLTQHSYFNLTGDVHNDILSHELTLNANAFLPVDATLIPTGELKPVAGGPFDFNTAKAIGKDIDAKDPQIVNGKGYDHCWAFTDTTKNLRPVASVYEPTSGRVIEVLTTEPGVQFYSGNFLTGAAIGKGGIAVERRHGFCLETQHFPDSPNKKSFPSVVLEPGKIYSTTTVYKFSTR